MKITVSPGQDSLFQAFKAGAAGEEIIITRAGQLLAKLVPIRTGPKTRILGSAKGEFVVPDHFNDPLSKHIEDSFYK
jgi:antitoxin (DNA-binding transcriptional repressor) of toxin-antitoxin stability system